VEVRPRPVLGGRRILIVEDSFLEAEDMRQSIEAAGGVAVGPASSVELALYLIDQDQPDAALLNVFVGRHSAMPIAKRLKVGQIPFVIVTGLSRDALPEMLRDAGYVAKPFLRQELVDALVKSLGLLTT
jgi:DNA-binding response OmpR family regulator